MWIDHSNIPASIRCIMTIQIRIIENLSPSLWCWRHVQLRSPFHWFLKSRLGPATKHLGGELSWIFTDPPCGNIHGFHLGDSSYLRWCSPNYYIPSNCGQGRGKIPSMSTAGMGPWMIYRTWSKVHRLLLL
jgi:hypothetical protein